MVHKKKDGMRVFVACCNRERGLLLGCDNGGVTTITLFGCLEVCAETQL
jgi:hypothetical protein